jgi:GT2 family glycosyltransferase
MRELQNKKSVSVVINTLNRRRYLKILFESLRHVDYKNFEVVVVNGPSSDGTEELLYEWEHVIKSGSCSSANLSMSRNIGIAMAAGEFIAFIDDDAIPEPEWLNQAVDAFESEEVAGVGGPVFDHTGYTFQCKYNDATRLGNSAWRFDYPVPYNCFPRSFEFPYLSGCNVIFRRRALVEIGGFDEEFQYYLDETDVCMRLIDAGYIIKQLSNSFVHHKYAESHIREHKIPKYRYPILKSKIYFSNRNAHSYCTQDEIDADNINFINAHRNEIIGAVSAGELSEIDLQEFEEHATDALIHGKQAAEKPQKLITHKLLELKATTYKRFQKINCKDTSLVIVFLCVNDSKDHDSEIECITRNKAIDLAALGHKVHVITRGSNYNTVDFEQGIWIHRILPIDSSRSEKAVELNVPPDVWNISIAFLDELDRISTHRDINIVLSPLSGMVSAAIVISGKYKVITILSKNESLDIKLCSENEKYDASNNVENFCITKYQIVKRSRGLIGADETEIKLIDSICRKMNIHHIRNYYSKDAYRLVQDYINVIDERSAKHNDN